MIASCGGLDTVSIIGTTPAFSPQYVAAKRVLASGAIGDVTTITAHGHPGSSLLVDGTHTVRFWARPSSTTRRWPGLWADRRR